MAGANWPRYIAANVCYPAGKSASRTAGVGWEPPFRLPKSGRWERNLAAGGPGLAENTTARRTESSTEGYW